MSSRKLLSSCPSVEEKSRATILMESRDFPVCFAWWDCKNFVWKNFPTCLVGQHKGKEKGKKIVLEVICSPHMYIWYFHGGETGSLNDLHILDRSSIVGSILNLIFDTCIELYMINETKRDWVYFLVDGIYPPMSIFAKTIAEPATNQERRYLKRHEYVRKDIKRCFGVLVSKFEILARSFCKRFLEDIRKIVKCCVIMHHKVVEDRCNIFLFNDLRSNMDQEVVNDVMNANDGSDGCHTLFG